MMMNRWFGIVVFVLTCVICVSGCSSRKNKFGRISDEENIAFLSGAEIEEDTLQTRPREINIITSITFDRVQFEYDSAQVSPAERGKVENVFGYLKKHPETSVIIEAHCDERGSREYNIALGERRALAVREYLLGLGVDSQQIQTKSYGEEKPLRMNHDEDSWRANRRAEFVFFN